LNLKVIAILTATANIFNSYLLPNPTDPLNMVSAKKYYNKITKIIFFIKKIKLEWMYNELLESE